MIARSLELANAWGMPNYFVRKMALRVALSDDDVKALLFATGTAIRVEAGKDLASEGDRPQGSPIILSGFACKYRSLRDGSRSILAYLIPGDGCDMHSSILQSMPHSIGALTDCVVALLDYRKIKELAACYPNIYLGLWWSVLVDEAILQELLVGVGRRPADKQVAYFLCDVFTRLQAIGIAREAAFKLPLTQSELADTAGLSKMHVHRVLTELRKQNLINVHHKGISIPDFARLKSFSGFCANYLQLKHLSAKDMEETQDLSDATRREFEKRFQSPIGTGFR